MHVLDPLDATAERERERVREVLVEREREVLYFSSAALAKESTVFQDFGDMVGVCVTPLLPSTPHHCCSGRLGPFLNYVNVVTVSGFDCIAVPVYVSANCSHCSVWPL